MNDKLVLFITHYYELLYVLIRDTRANSWAEQGTSGTVDASAHTHCPTFDLNDWGYGYRSEVDLIDTFISPCCCIWIFIIIIPVHQGCPLRSHICTCNIIDVINDILIRYSYFGKLYTWHFKNKRIYCRH